jgi:hypothetical protein
LRIVCLLAALAANALSAPAFAQFTLGAGVEYFSWTEDTQPIKVKERGPLGVLDIGWTQQRDRGFLFAYRGQLYGGGVTYNGSLLNSPSTPVSSTTSYVGTWHEAQGRYRIGSVDVLAALGFDVWNRRLSADQQEDYQVAFVRVGFERMPRERGWIFGAGAKYPIWTQEDAHFNQLGFDQNPKLKPGKDVSGFARFGYRFNRNWSLVGFMDSYRFKQSDVVFVTAGGVPQGGFLQPKTDVYTLGASVHYTF